MSTTDRHVVNGDVVDSLTGTGSVQPLSSMYVNSNINGYGGRVRLFQRNDVGSDFTTLYSSTQNTPPPPPPSNGSGIGGLFDFLGTGNMVGGNIHNAKISLSDRDRAALERSIDMQNDSMRRLNQFSRGMFGRQDDGVNGQEHSGIPLSPPFMRDPQSSESSASSIADDSESGFGSNSSSRKHALSHSYLSKLTDGSDDSEDERRLTQATFAFRSIDLCQKQWASNQRPPDYSSSNRLPSVNCNQMAPFPLNVDVNDPEHGKDAYNIFICCFPSVTNK